MIEHLIVDSSALIRNFDLKAVGKRFYTVANVVNEIRDKATRDRLSVLPYTLEFKEPSDKSLLFVTEFAKKTGDYRSLSAVDLQLLALAHQLHQEHGKGTCRSEPKCDAWLPTKRVVAPDHSIVGFYFDSKTCHASPASTNLAHPSDSLTPTENLPTLSNLNIENKSLSSTTTHECSEQPTALSDSKQDPEDNTLSCSVENNEKTTEPVAKNLKDISSRVELAEDDANWITPENFAELRQRQIGTSSSVQQSTTVIVASLTADFAMQNVLLQMGLHVVSSNGMLIRRARCYALRCEGCFRTTLQLDKEFCPGCGHKTLRKVAVQVSADGTREYRMCGRATSHRGAKFSLPAPKGGKHSDYPRLCEDMPRPQQRRPRKMMQRLDALDPDYVGLASPFADRDTTSRAAALGLFVATKSRWERKNPNVPLPRGRKVRSSGPE